MQRLFPDVIVNPNKGTILASNVNHIRGKQLSGFVVLEQVDASFVLSAVHRVRIAANGERVAPAFQVEPTP